jgi:serine acetyltransferase
MCILPIVAKWVLIGRWKTQEFPVWSLAYIRFWLVKALVRANPLLLLVGGRSRSNTTSPITFKNVLWWMVGVRIGRRFFDDGLSMTERSLVTIGDDCTANQTSVIQGHSQEDGAFKSDYITIGSRVTFGAGAWINYGATVGDDVIIEPHSYVMKGEEISPGARWSGNPAVEVRADHDVARPVRQVIEGAARV